MASIQTVEEIIAQLTSGNDLYSDNRDQWQYLLESYLGGDDYRDGQHLTRYQLETSAEYMARLRSTPLQNHCKSVISVYNSFMFREPPEREFGSMNNLPDLKDFLRDADLDGRSFDSFMKDVSTWSSVFGHCWVVLAKPNIQAVTRADEIAIGVRPYVSLLTPLTVLDWRWERDITGRYTLSYLKYVEDINGDVQVIKEWTPEMVWTWSIDTNNKIIQEQTQEVNGLGYIPAVVAYSNRSMVRGLGISDIADIADAQRFIYNCTSEVEQSIRLDSHPSLVKTPETQAGSGAGSLIHMPENLDPGLKPYILEFSGAEISSIYSSIEHTIASIDKMANTGAVRTTESRDMSGVAMETEFQLLNARLAEKADNMELAEEQIWRIWADYQGYEWDGKVEYPGSFNIRDNDREVAQLKMAADTNPVDPRVRAAIDAKLLDYLEIDTDEAMAIANPDLIDLDSVVESEDAINYSGETMVDPATGVEIATMTPEQQTQLALAGWVKKE